MCMMIDEDFWSVFNTTQRRANKPHRCGECGRTINKGERYQYSTGNGEGHWYTYHQCAHCYTAADWLGMVCDGWLFDAIQEDLANHVDGDESYLRSEPLAKLVDWMRADWLDVKGDLRSVADVLALTNAAKDAYREQFAKAVPA